MATRGRGRGVSTNPRGASLVGRRGRGGGPVAVPLHGPASANGKTGRPVNISPHVTTVGVKRPNFGTAGRPLEVFANSFETSLPDSIIHHYDVIHPDEKTLPAKLNMRLIEFLQKNVALGMFTPPAVYDGRKNLFAIRALPFPGGAESHDFRFTFGDDTGHPPKDFTVRLTKVAEINPETLQRFIVGKQSHDNHVLTAITALNVVVRMQPSLTYPCNTRSFFTPREVSAIGGGIELWRGYFQSVRPGIERCFINVDISTGAMFRGGSLIELALDVLGRRPNDVMFLSSRNGIPVREVLRLQRQIAGVRVITDTPGAPPKTRTVKKLTTRGASQLMFLKNDQRISVAQYFQSLGIKLKYPDLICVQVGNGAIIPFELCRVPPGQLMRKQVPADKTDKVVEFATQPPQQRMRAIQDGRAVLAYGQSEYVRAFGLNVNTEQGLVKVNARVLTPPKLQYGKGSKQATIQPKDGAWNMIDKKFYLAQTIKQWVVVNFENRFNDASIEELIKGFVSACRQVGMVIPDRPAYKVPKANGQASISKQLDDAREQCQRAKSTNPSLIIVVLPENGNDMYTEVKFWGDIQNGIPTQCLKAKKCLRATSQYYANVCLKVNVKIGGINTIPEASSVTALTDPHHPTVVFGADVVHPAPGTEGRPSFTSVVGNVDSNNAKYIATARVQTGRQEIIEDLDDMAKHILAMAIDYRIQREGKPPGAAAPKRIIFFRDGVSEGQFKAVLEQELPLLKKACKELGIDAKITMIIVAKRHHQRFFPKDQRDGDRRSGNCPAGTVIDSDIAHPTEFDFYLQSHGGLLGTSRPAHYSVLYDENNFTADSLQSLSFALCHLYARSTRSVSIPAPVYYADIVCARAKTHYDPAQRVDSSESAGDSEEQPASLDAFKRDFKALHDAQARRMYFSGTKFQASRPVT
ncbi:Piwi-domain-containing protein [Schizophyllum commune Loenen D]|nr:Piwi-domain-containing protein [Schizophyllum commune Loenen D]